MTYYITTFANVHTCGEGLLSNDPPLTIIIFVSKFKNTANNVNMQLNTT